MNYESPITILRRHVESEQVLKPSSESPQSRPPGLAPLAAGLILLAIYFIIAAQTRFFVASDFVYPQHSSSLIRGIIPELQLYSMFWKLILLLPASILLAIGMARRGFSITVPTAGRERIILGGIVLLVTVILVISTRFIFRETEVTDDENVYDYQARTLLLGRLSNPGVPAVRCFDNQFIVNNDTLREGKYTPGHPAVIALGMALGDRYIATIALSALTILLIYGIAVELYGDRRLAILAAILMAFSPFFCLVSSSLLSHTTEAFCLALFMYLFLRARVASKPGIRLFTALAAGLALGYAFNVRQLTALGFALPFGVLVAADLRTPAPGRIRMLAAMAAGFAIMLIATLWMNYLMTGNALLFPFNFYNPGERVGFGVMGHTFSAGVLNTSMNFLKLNAILFGFPASLMFIIPVLVAPKASGDRLLLGILASIAAVYLFYYSPGISDLGPVYYYEMIIPAILLSVRGIVLVHRFASERLPYGKNLVPQLLAVSCVLALLTTFPERAAYRARLAERIRSPYTLVESLNIHHAVVMVDSWPNRRLVYGYREASPDFHDDVIYCRMADAASNLKLAGMFPDRKLYVMKYLPDDDRTVVTEITGSSVLHNAHP